MRLQATPLSSSSKASSEIHRAILMVWDIRTAVTNSSIQRAGSLSVLSRERDPSLPEAEKEPQTTTLFVLHVNTQLGKPPRKTYQWQSFTTAVVKSATPGQCKHAAVTCRGSCGRSSQSRKIPTVVHSVSLPSDS